MKIEKASVIMSVYYKESPAYLTLALESLVNQTFQANEIVIVEDGFLTDELYSVLKNFNEKLPIKRVVINENKGLGNALNVGLKACSYDIVLRMDTDDICHKHRFEKQVDFMMNNPDVSILGTWVKDINENGNIIGERTFPTSHEDLYRVIWACPFAHPTVAFRKTAIESIGSYNTKIKRRQDYELWMRAAKKGLKFANIPEYLLYYRFTDDYYKKNDLKVAYQQAQMGWKGLRELKIKGLYPYFAVATPMVRAILPEYFAKKLHKLARKVDPRRQLSNSKS